MGRKLSELKVNPKNPRKITDPRLKSLAKSMAEYGDISGVVFNRRTGNLVGGNQRSKDFDKDSKVVVTKSFSKPTAKGTVAIGYILHEGERFNYREVDWPEDKETAAMIRANKNAGEWDPDSLSEALRGLSSFDIDYDLELTGFDTDELSGFGILDNGSHTVTEHDRSNPTYTGKIETPIYEIRGEKPDLSDCFNLDRATQLLRDIDTSEVSKEEKEFLIQAAQRHVVFNFQKIAEYYANASKEMKLLMEDSALVIIDFKKAIEKGFLILTETLGEAYDEE